MKFYFTITISETNDMTIVLVRARPGSIYLVITVLMSVLLSAIILITGQETMKGRMYGVSVTSHC